MGKCPPARVSFHKVKEARLVRKNCLDGSIQKCKTRLIAWVLYKKKNDILAQEPSAETLLLLAELILTRRLLFIQRQLLRTN